VRPTDSRLDSQLESAVQLGQTLLLDGVAGDKVEPWGLIEPLLSRRTFRTGVGAGFDAVKLGNRTV